MQRFLNTAELLDAFKKIQLKQIFVNNNNKVTLQADTNKSAIVIKCYNCNSKGHMANECRKSKREPGSCFVCAEMGHTSINCPKRKNINPLESTNNSNSFVRKIDYFVVPNETMEYPAILGTDFLEKERFVLIKESKLRLESKVSKDESKKYMEEKLPNKKNVSEYNELYLNQNEENLSEIERECRNLMGIDLDKEENTLIINNTNIHLKYHFKLQQIFKQYYLNTEIPKKPETKCYLK